MTPPDLSSLFFLFFFSPRPTGRPLAVWQLTLQLDMILLDLFWCCWLAPCFPSPHTPTHTLSFRPNPYQLPALARVWRWWTWSHGPRRPRRRPVTVVVAAARWVRNITLARHARYARRRRSALALAWVPAWGPTVTRTPPAAGPQTGGPPAKALPGTGIEPASDLRTDPPRPFCVCVCVCVCVFSLLCAWRAVVSTECLFFLWLLL